MPETSADEFGYLRCPRTRLPLRRDASGSYVTDTEDIHRRFVYRVVGGLPILIDFAASALDESETMARAVASPAEAHHVRGLATLAQRLVNPLNPKSARNVASFRRLLRGLSSRPRLLVVGGATLGAGMRILYEDPSIDVVGFDIYRSPLVQFVADAHSIPVADATFDGVVIQAVLEYVLRPDVVVSEIHRVLRDDGIVYAETPFLQQIHGGPFDFTRFTESGHRYLFRRFERIDSGPLDAAGTQMLWTVDFLVRGLLRSWLAGKVAKVAFFWLRYLDRLIPERFAVDSASGTYFLGRRSEHELGPTAIIAHYRGAA